MEQFTPGSTPWLFAIFAAAIVAQWGFIIWTVRTARTDARADRKRCEDANAKLQAEIVDVRNQQNGRMTSALESTAIAMHAATTAQHRGNDVLDRLCRTWSSLPCAKDGAERRDITEPTPTTHKHG